MRRQKSQQQLRPFETVMDEAGEGTSRWNLGEHLNGCLKAYQMNGRYEVAVFFALEALWGIARDVSVQARAGSLDPAQLDEDWILPPNKTLPVPWIWIRALSTAWEKYKTENGPLGHAFGLEGGGQGRAPTIAKLMKMLDELAIARWIGSQLQAARAAQKKILVEGVILDAAEKFNLSDTTIKRAWRRFGAVNDSGFRGGHNFRKW